MEGIIKNEEMESPVERPILRRSNAKVLKYNKRNNNNENSNDANSVNPKEPSIINILDKYRTNPHK
jgi:hypothetical protein|tara:strand:- start:9208 stop:9405 length:198 start_codon:yes stop_codon:yes gene_type:complete